MTAGSATLPPHGQSDAPLRHRLLPGYLLLSLQHPSLRAHPRCRGHPRTRRLLLLLLLPRGGRALASWGTRQEAGRQPPPPSPSTAGGAHATWTGREAWAPSLQLLRPPRRQQQQSRRRGSEAQSGAQASQGQRMANGSALPQTSPP